MPKISALPANAVLDGTEELPLVQGGVTKRASVDDLDTFLSGTYAPRNIAQVTTGDYTFTGAVAAFTKLGTATASLTITGTKMLITMSGSWSFSDDPGIFELQFNIDSGTLVPIGYLHPGNPAVSGVEYGYTFAYLATGLAPGAHTVDVEYKKVSAGTIYLRGVAVPRENLRIILEEK